MKVIIKGHSADVGDSLKKYIEEVTVDQVSKYFNHATRADVTLSKSRNHMFNVDITLYESLGPVLHSTASDSDAYHGFDIAIAKVVRQLRKYKEKLVNKRRRSGAEVKQAEVANYSVISTESDDHVDDDAAAAIIIDKQKDIPHLTLNEAVMRLDMMDMSAMLFINSASGCVNMIYYRRIDGNIGWIKTSCTPPA